MRLIFVFPTFFLCISCSNLLKKPEQGMQSQFHWSVIHENDSSIDLSIMLAQKRAVDRILKREKSTVVEKKEKWKKLDSVVNYVLDTRYNHPKVQKWIKYYCQEDRERFQRFLNRGVRYKKMVQEIFLSQGLPPDLYYLGILESGYSKKAVSRAGAVGFWQFMAPTGREYGLKINNYVDERIDPIRSTLAASRYLKELYRQKKTWSLALASYNAGPGRVRKAIRRGVSRNYWSLTRRRLLPYDTREYVPQFLAILYIGKNLKKFNFHEKQVKPLPFLELIEVPSPLKISQIAKTTGLSSKEILKNNLHILKKVTPPEAKKYPIWVQSDYKELLVKNYKALSKHRLRGLKARRFISSYGKKRRSHRVRRGDTLSTVARRYGLSVGKIKRFNGLKSNRIYVGQRLKLYNVRKISSSVQKKVRRYRVRSGDTLSTVARRYGLSVGKIKRFNGLKSNRIYVGQRLKLYNVRKISSSVQKKVRRYRVRSGDTLSTVARRYGLSVGKIKRFNGLKSNRIYVGQRLKLYNVRKISSSVQKKVRRYRIRPGDNLHKISKRFGLTVRQIKKINNLKTDRIIHGKYLLLAGKP